MKSAWKRQTYTGDKGRGRCCCHIENFANPAMATLVGDRKDKLEITAFIDDAGKEFLRGGEQWAVQGLLGLAVNLLRPTGGQKKVVISIVAQDK